MSVKKKLNKVGPDIVSMIPIEIKELAKKVERSPKNVPKMLRGEIGSEKNCTEVAMQTLLLIIDNAESSKERALAIMKELSIESIKSVSAAS